MKNAIIILLSVAIGILLGALIFRASPQGASVDFARKLEAQNEQIRLLSESVRMQQENVQRFEKMFSRGQHTEKLSAKERRKQYEQSYAFVTDLARKIVNQIPLPAGEAQPFVKRVETYARAMAFLYYDESNDSMAAETRSLRARELTETLNKDVEKILSAENFKKYLVIVREYQSPG